MLIPIKLANEFKMDLNSISRKIENVKAEPKVIELKQGIEAIKKGIEKESHHQEQSRIIFTPIFTPIRHA